MLPRPLLALFLLLLAATAGCDGQVDPSYKGVPLGTIHGSVVVPTPPTAPSAGLDALEAALVWTRYTLNDQRNFDNTPLDQSLLTKTSVVGEFPATFTLQVFTPPPSEAFLSCYPSGDPRVGHIALASVIVVAAGTQVLESRDPAAVRGMAVDYGVLYLDHDLDPTSMCASLTAVTSAGYHLVHRRASNAELDAYGAEYKACMDAALCDPSNPATLQARLVQCEQLHEDAYQLVDAPQLFDTPVTIQMRDDTVVAAPPSEPPPASEPPPPSAPPSGPTAPPGTSPGCP